jgi:prefoldin subunit 5
VYDGLGHVSRQVAQLQAQVAELTRTIDELRVRLGEPTAAPSDQD